MIREQAHPTISSGHPTRPAPLRWSAPPLPREHGGWVMLSAPLLINLLAAPAPPLIPCLLLLLAATSAFCLQHAVELTRRRGPAGVLLWAAGYLALLLASGLPLLIVYHFSGLLSVAALAASAVGIKSLLSLTHPRRRFDRTLGGEMLGVLALTLTGPAASVITHGRLEADAWILWAGMVLYFTSGVFFVNLLLAGARCKTGLDARTRWRLGRGHLLYHALLAALVGYTAAAMTRQAAFLFTLAYAPILVRAFQGWIDLGWHRLNLKRVGWTELLYSLWFVGCGVTWLRLG